MIKDYINRMLLRLKHFLGKNNEKKPKFVKPVNIWRIDNPYYLDEELMLWRENDKSFRVAKSGKYLAMLKNYDYIIVHRKYQDILRRIPEQVEIKNIIINDYVKKTSIVNYIELMIINKIDEKTIYELTSEGIKIWTDNNRNIFITKELKNLLKKVSKMDFFS